MYNLLFYISTYLHIHTQTHKLIRKNISALGFQGIMKLEQSEMFTMKLETLLPMRFHY